jgi:predicted 3-demethylubiquinone-9 3-methyltransferase (glyoxalase superfamily)
VDATFPSDQNAKRIEFEIGGLMSALQNFPRITPFLWFDSNAEEAVDFYLSAFRNSRRLDGLSVSGGAGGQMRKPLAISFELDGQKFTALNGGPTFKFTEAISFVVRCDSQQEIDEYWAAGRSEPNKPGIGLAHHMGGIRKQDSATAFWLALHLETY